MSTLSELSICNAALVKIGHERISSMDEPSKSAYLAKERYAYLRDEVLEAHPWNFAMKRVLLAPMVIPPAYGYAFQFALPNDCLRIWAPANEGVRFEVEDGKVLTDESSFPCRYIARVENPNKFSRAFSECLAFRLAGELAYAIAQSTTLQQTMMQGYEMSLRSAKSNDAQEGNAQEDFLQGSWLRERF